MNQTFQIFAVPDMAARDICSCQGQEANEDARLQLRCLSKACLHVQNCTVHVACQNRAGPGINDISSSPLWKRRQQKRGPQTQIAESRPRSSDPGAMYFFSLWPCVQQLSVCRTCMHGWMVWLDG